MTPHSCRETAGVAVCCKRRCSVLQCVAVCCSVLQCVAVCCSVLQCVAVCCKRRCSVLHLFVVVRLVQKQQEHGQAQRLVVREVAARV